MLVQPYHTFQKTQHKPTQPPKRAYAKQTQQRPSPAYWHCRFCSHRITPVDAAIEVNGAHEHYYRNPAGILYHIACFNQANGCIDYDLPTLTETWFSGYAWNFALCAGCKAHLGWFYQYTASEETFYGLIMPNLLREQD